MYYYQEPHFNYDPSRDNTPVRPGWRPYCVPTATENGPRARPGRNQRGGNAIHRAVVAKTNAKVRRYDLERGENAVRSRISMNVVHAWQRRRENGTICNGDFCDFYGDTTKRSRSLWRCQGDVTMILPLLPDCTTS